MNPQEDNGKPLVIMDESAHVVGIAAMNRKAYAKSTEHGELWIVHDESGRVLPYGKTVRFKELIDEGSWYRTVIVSGGGTSETEARTAGAAPVSDFRGARRKAPDRGTAAEEHVADGGAVDEGAVTGNAADEGETGEGAAGATNAEPGKRSAAAPDTVGALARLQAVIERRRRERPDGSYTTYLFDSGEEKIRKKTGEEAIELVLARDRGEIVSEAADLIYHLLVLLNQLDIPLEEVLEELERRA